MSQIDMVMQYLCLTYGSNNDQYRNYCYFKEKVDNTDVHNRELTARAPCRGFCVQVIIHIVVFTVVALAFNVWHMT